MTRIRKHLSKEILNEQLNEVSRSSVEETEKKSLKRKKVNEEKKPAKKKAKLECGEEDYARSIGRSTKVTYGGLRKKYHYDKFEFHGQQYGLDDSVLLVPEKPSHNPYVAIIKEIFRLGSKKGYVKLKVQWFYRPRDVNKKHVGNWESKDSRCLFFSFHYDEVYAESVLNKCIVHFVPDNKEIPKPREHPGFIARKVYDFFKKKMLKFSHKGFHQQRKDEINSLLAKTISQIGDLPDIVNKQKRKRSVPRGTNA